MRPFAPGPQLPVPAGLRYGASAAALALGLALVPGVSGARGQADTALANDPAGSWVYPGGGGPETEMLLSADGAVRFEGMFEDLGPGSWSMAEGSGPMLALRLPALDSQGMDIIAKNIEQGYLPTEADSLDRENRTVFYDLSESPCQIDLMGWMFFRQHDACPR